MLVAALGGMLARPVPVVPSPKIALDDIVPVEIVVEGPVWDEIIEVACEELKLGEEVAKVVDWKVDNENAEGRGEDDRVRDRTNEIAVLFDRMKELVVARDGVVREVMVEFIPVKVFEAELVILAI